MLKSLERQSTPLAFSQLELRNINVVYRFKWIMAENLFKCFNQERRLVLFLPENWFAEVQVRLKSPSDEKRKLKFSI